MSAGKIITFILAAILILFGVLFVLSAFSSQSPNAPFASILVGVILAAIGFGLIWFAARQKPAAADQNVTLKIDLPGDVKLDTLKCQACGGVLSPKDITLVNGAPVVTCPYCHTTYQLTEEPKW